MPYDAGCILDMLFGNKKLDELYERARSIVRSDSDDATKQQELFDLAQEIGLPIDSSDVRCRCLSYSEMFDRISDWIRERRAERRATINVYAAFASALTAMLAVSVSCFIHWQTRQLLAPIERPIVVAVSSKCKGEINNDNNKLEISLNIDIKNVGKHPAENMRVRVWGALMDDPNDLETWLDFTLADILFPDIPRTVTLPKRITIQLKSFEAVKEQRKKVFIYVKMDYTDGFMPEMKYTQDLHWAYEIGKGNISSASLKEKQVFESRLKDAAAT